MPFAFVLAFVLALLAVFQLALALGAPLGRFAWGGQHRVLPPRLRIGSAVAIVIYAFIVVVAWDRVGAIHVFPDLFSAVFLWIAFAYFAFGILLNAISRGIPERITMVPVCIVLAAASFGVAMGWGAVAIAV